MDIEQFKEIENDKTLHCIDCDKDFVFTIGEQRYFVSRGLSAPKRCVPCRQIRKVTINK